MAGAQFLLKICSGGPLADKVNQGVLIGSGHVHTMSHQERQTVVEYLQSVAAGDVQVDEAVESYRSAFLPMHCEPVGGKVYRKGDCVAAIHGGAEVFFQIQDLFLVKANDVYQSLVIGDTFQLIINPAGGWCCTPSYQ